MKTSLIFLLLACGLAGAATRPAAPEQASADLRAQIQAQIADNACDSSRQCHTLPMGAKACGGPDNYVAWSDKTVDGDKLKQLADNYAAARRADNLRLHLMSTCVVTPDPGATCRAGRCVLLPPGPGNGATSAQ